MFRTAYSTNAASSFMKAEIQTNLAIAMAEGTLVNVDPAIPSLFALVDRGPRGKEIDDFDHPVHLVGKGGGQSGNGYWVIDMRPYAARILTQDGKIEAPKDSPAALMILRAKTEMYWNQFPAGEMMFWGDLPFVVFARWLTGTLKGRLGLEPADISHMQTLSAYYFYNLFYEEGDFGEKQKAAIALKINRILGIPVDRAQAWIKPLGYMSTLDDLVKAMVNNVDNPAVATIDTKYLANATMNSWFGSADSRALIAVALEFPPAFIAMLLACGNSSQYKKSPIGDAVEREKAKWRFNEYQRLAFDAFKSLK